MGINDQVGTPDQHALLMEFDQVHGRWPRATSSDVDCLTRAGQGIGLTNAKRIEDLLFFTTGVFRAGARIVPCFAARVKKSSSRLRSGVVVRRTRSMAQPSPL